MQTQFYPPPTSRPLPRWIESLGVEEKGLLAEIYIAIDAGSHRLAMMGARALVDIVMNREGDQVSFKGGLASLERRGLIASQSRDVLSAALAHRETSDRAFFSTPAQPLAHTTWERGGDLGKNPKQLSQVLTCRWASLHVSYRN